MIRHYHRGMGSDLSNLCCSDELPHSAVTMGSQGAYMSWKVFSEYATMGSLILRDLFCAVMDRLLGDKKSLATTLPAQGVTTLMDQKKENRLVHHLLYASPVKRGNGIEVIEDILPVYGIECQIRPGKQIKNVYLAPQMEPIPFTQENGIVRYTVEKLFNHQMVVLEY